MFSNLKRSWLLLLALVAPLWVSAQVSWLDYFPTVNDSISITFDATQGNSALVGVDTVYIHTGIITSGPTGTGWNNTVGTWGVRDARVRMRPLGNNKHLFRIPNIRTFYNYPTGNAFRLGMVFRNRDGSRVGRSATGSDIFIPLYQAGQAAVRITNPSGIPVVDVEQGQLFTVEARSNNNYNLKLYALGNQVGSANGKFLNQGITLNTLGYSWVKVEVDNGGGVLAKDSFRVYVRKPQPVAAIPNGMQYGINYLPNNTSVVLAFYAPFKSFSFLLGDFNNFDRNNDYLMTKTPDGASYWIQIDNLTPGSEVAFQYLVDGSIRTGELYSDLILDPNNDQFIPQSTYPGIRTYPRNAQGLVSVLQTAQTPYNWQNTNFVKPAQKDLVIYEAWVYDFTAARNFKRLQDSLVYLKRLGINCIELMPVNEFDGNISWGYNPSYHHAIDKAYGSRNAFKAFVDAAHGLGIAVVIDMVFNHATGENPLAKLYWDNGNSRPAANSPFMNPIAKHPFNVYNDINHENAYIQYYIDRVNKHYVQEYKVDGFRFDLSKGFTQTDYGNDVGRWSSYDAGRIRLLKRMADQIWATDPSTYIIFEHLADNSEETELANYGIMLWGNMNSAYMEAVEGNASGSDMSWGFYRNRGWNNPKLVSYMESHDEERIMYNAKLNGLNIVPTHNIRNTDIALHRFKAAANVFFTIPGPKMIWQFGELGYDYSINNCPNGTVNGSCRTDPKPLRWDYYTDANRINLWKAYQALIKLKLEEPIFQNPTPTLTLGGTSYKIVKNSLNGQHVIAASNFAVGATNLILNFQQTGKWYEFFTGDSITVNNVNQVVNFGPSDFKIFSTKKFYKPERSILTALDEDLGLVSAASDLVLYPNPATQEVNIRLNLNQMTDVTLQVYDLKGQLVHSKTDVMQPIGTYHTKWDGFNATGCKLNHGLYLVKVMAGGKQLQAKLVID